MSVETDVLSAIVKHKTLKPFVDFGLNSKFFEDDDTHKAFEFIEEFHSKHSAIPEAKTLMKKFPDVTITDVKEPMAHYCEQLYEKFRKNRVKETLREVVKELDDKPEDTIKKIEGMVMELQRTRRYKDSSFIESIPRRLELYQKRKECKGIDGIQCGLPALDKELNGFKGEDFIIVSGRQKVGKSFLLSFFAKQFVKLGMKVLFVTKEMSVAAIQSRVECMMYALPYGEFKSAKLKPEDEKKYIAGLTEAREAAKGDIFFVQDASTVSGVVVKAKEYKADVVIIDGLYLLEDMRSKSIWEKVTNISRDLKKAAQSLKVPLIASTQLNRGAAGSKSSPKMENLSFADALGQDADAVLGLYQTEDMREDKKIFLRLMGSRESDKCTLMLDWDLEKMNIKESKMDKKSEAMVEKLSDDDLVSGTPAF